MGKRSFTNGVVGALAITAIAGCGDPFVLVPSSASSGAGASASGGDGGSTSSVSGGGGMGGGSAGACKPGDLKTCNEKQYCRRDNMTCADCSQVLARFSFGAPQKISSTPPSGGSSLRFPRSGPNGQLLFTFTSAGGNADLGHSDASSAFLEWKGGIPEAAPPNSGAEDAASFYLSKGSVLATLLVNANVKTDTDIVLFESAQQGGGKQIFAFNPMKTAISQVDLKGGTANSRLTIAYDVPRFWFTSNVKMPSTPTGEELVTAQPGIAPEPVSILDSAGCPVQGNISPWATPDGNMMLFATQKQDKVNNVCKLPPTGSLSRLFYTPMSPNDGKPSDPKANAQEIFPETTSSFDAPALREDLCVLYFHENLPSGATQLYASVRE